MDPFMANGLSATQNHPIPTGPFPENLIGTNSFAKSDLFHHPHRIDSPWWFQLKGYLIAPSLLGGYRLSIRSEGLAKLFQSFHIRFWNQSVWLDHYAKDQIAISTNRLFIDPKQLGDRVDSAISFWMPEPVMNAMSPSKWSVAHTW